MLNKYHNSHDVIKMKHAIKLADDMENLTNLLTENSGSYKHNLENVRLQDKHSLIELKAKIANDQEELAMLEAQIEKANTLIENHDLLWEAKISEFKNFKGRIERRVNDMDTTE